MKNEYSELKKLMEESKNTVVVTGAGISYLYGIRRLKGIVGQYNAGLFFTEKSLRENPERFYEVVKDAFLDATFIKGPSTVHKQLAALEERGMIQGIVTQNMDCLHTIAGSKNVVEFQGSFGDNICIDCHAHNFDYQVWNQGHVPHCSKCGGYLMPASFSGHKELYNNMPKAIKMISEADLIIIVGTTGFRSNEYLKEKKPEAKIVQINPEATGFDTIADLNIREDAALVFDYILSGSDS